MGKKSLSLAEIATLLGAELRGQPDFEVSGLGDLRSANAEQISFLSSVKYEADLSMTKAGAVLVKAEHADLCATNCVVVEDPYYAFAVLSEAFATRDKREIGIHPSAVIHASAKLGENVAIAAHCSVGAGAVIGDNVELYPGVFVGERSHIGDNSILFPNVVIYHEVSIGEDVIVHANTTIGADGFGFAQSQGRWKKIHQLGRVRIGDRVEVGASSTIDRGAIGDTIIEDGVIIDNQVHIGHNCRVGENSAIAGCSGIGGSTIIGKNCQIAGMVGIGGHLHIADGTIFLGGTDVAKGTKEGGVYASISPMQTATDWRKTAVRVKQLDSLFERVKKLEQQKD